MVLLSYSASNYPYFDLVANNTPQVLSTWLSKKKPNILEAWRNGGGGLGEFNTSQFPFKCMLSTPCPPTTIQLRTIKKSWQNIFYCSTMPFRDSITVRPMFDCPGDQLLMLLTQAFNEMLELNEFGSVTLLRGNRSLFWHHIQLHWFEGSTNQN